MERLTKSEEALVAGASTAYDVAAALPWTRQERSFSDLDLFNKTFATRETFAHLNVLVSQGHAVRADAEGVAHFTRVTPP